MREDRYPRKRLSQNFLTNPHFAKRIAEQLDISPDDIVIEIGPGRGALTGHLLEAGPAHLLAVEVDPRWAEYLREHFEDRIEVIQADFMEFDWYNRSGQRVKLAGNLPYHITSPLLFHVIDHFRSARSAVFMTQKEVARRICAEPGTKDYGILSVLCQACARIRYAFTVGRGNFQPVPGVDSAVFHMDFLETMEGVQDPGLFRKIVRASFNYRRKMLRNSLSRIFEKSIVYSLNAVNVDRRPENLTVDEFKSLTNELIQRIRSSNV